MPFNFNLPALSGFSLESITQLASGSNLILPIVGLFLARFLARMVFGSLLLLPILAIVFLIFSSQPDIMQGFGDLSGISNKFNKDYIMPALILGALFIFFRPVRFSPVSILMLAGIAYLLFSRDFRIESLISAGNWKTSAVGIALLAVVALIFFFRRRAFNPYQRPISFTWVQPLCLAAALAFSGLILKNPNWLESHLPGWRSSIGFAVLIASSIGFFYNLPLRFRPYAICASWLFVAFTVVKVILI
jgi:hypothetical protein